MQDFEFRVYGVRRAAPSIMFVLTRDEDSARTMAERTLEATKGCSRIDVWVACRYLFTVEPAECPAAQGGGREGPLTAASVWRALRRSGLRFLRKKHARAFESLA